MDLTNSAPAYVNAYKHIRKFEQMEKDLEVLQKRCKTRVIEPVNVLGALKDFTDWSKYEGVQFILSAGERVAKSYKFTPESTVVKGIFRKGKWEITAMGRVGHAPTKNFLEFRCTSYKQAFEAGLTNKNCAVVGVLALCEAGK